MMVLPVKENALRGLQATTRESPSEFDLLGEWPALRQHFDLGWRLFGVNLALISPDGMRSVCFDHRNRLAPVCMAIQQQSEGHRLCEECDRRFLKQAARQLGPMRYRCHAGLTEYIIPIICHGKVAAFIQGGQIVDAAVSKDELERIREIETRLGMRSAMLEKQLVSSRRVPSARQEDLALFLKMLAQHLAHLVISEFSEPQQYSHQVLRRVLAYIEFNLDEPLPIRKVAKAAGISPRSLSRVFRSELDMSVVEFINNRRIDRACQQLACSDRSCIEIAFSVGFRSIQNFNRMFQRIKHTTPREWRRQATEQHH